MNWPQAFALLSRYYGFTIRDILKLTLYQFRAYMDNLNIYEDLMAGEKPEEREVCTDEEIMDVVKKYGVEVPE